MDKRKCVIKRIFHPPVWVMLVLIPCSVLGLVIAFSDFAKDSLICYINYALSAYTMIVVCLCRKDVIRTISKGFWDIPLIRNLNETKFGHLFLNDITFRGIFSIYQGLVINFFYVVFRGITACLYKSVWFGVISAYYLFLCLIRLMLARSSHNLKNYREQPERGIFEYKAYRMSGCMLFLLNAGITGMAVLMIRDNLHYEYPGYVIYLSAGYTFYVVITAVINVFKFRKLKSPILSASKIITLTGAMMSVFALQTAMIARFGGESGLFRVVANTITGTVVCISSVAFAVYMILRANYKISKLKVNETKV